MKPVAPVIKTRIVVSPFGETDLTLGFIVVKPRLYPMKIANRKPHARRKSAGIKDYAITVTVRFIAQLNALSPYPDIIVDSAFGACYKFTWQAARGDSNCCPDRPLLCPLGRHFRGH